MLIKWHHTVLWMQLESFALMTHCVETCFSGVSLWRRWDDTSGLLFLYCNPALPNSNSFKVLLPTWTSLWARLNSLSLVIIPAEASAKLCYVPCVNLKIFLFGLEQKYFAAWLFQELTSRMEAVAVPFSFPPLLTASQQLLFKSSVEFLWVWKSLYWANTACFVATRNEITFCRVTELAVSQSNPPLVPSNTSVSHKNHAFDLLENCMLSYYNG